MTSPQRYNQIMLFTIKDRENSFICFSFFTNRIGLTFIGIEISRFDKSSSLGDEQKKII